MAALEALESGGLPTLLQTFRAHGANGEITCCDIAPGGARLLTGGGDRALRAWCWLPGAGWEELAAAPRAHRYGITAARWSPGGALAASGGVDGAARVWSGRELTPRRLLAAPGAPALRTLCWASAGVLLSGYDDGSACVWHVRRATMIARLHVHQGALHAIGAPARGALLLTACTEGVLKVFDLQEVCRSAAEEVTVIPAPLMWVDCAHDMGVLCCDVTADGGIAATGGHDSRIRLWYVRREAGGPRRTEAGGTLEGHGAAVTALRWAGRALASAALDRTARVWSPAGACLCVLNAHSRYLTCVALAPDLRYMITGSNDKTVRAWSLGELTLAGALEPPCSPLAHFGVGDLEGLGPVDDNELLASDVGDALDAEGAGGGEEEAGAGAARLVWRALDAHGGAVNCIAVHEQRLATACSDGIVRVFRWSGSELEQVCELGERGYPALAAALGAGGAVLLTAGLDGAAKLWDVDSGCLLRVLVAPAAAEHESGGGGARGAGVSPHRPPFLLLATDDGVAPLWSLADSDPAPLHVFGGHADAATSCAWSRCGRVAATGGAAGELRLLAPPPAPRTLAHVAHAHDLGVQSCDFASEGTAELPDDTLLLATAGSDALIKLWQIKLDEEMCNVQISMVGSVVGHGGGAASVRWGGAGRLVSAGADGWARVWRLCGGGGGGGGAPRLRQVAAVPAHAAAGTATAVFLDQDLVVLGSLSGELAVWRLPVSESEDSEGVERDTGAEDSADEDAGAEPRWWGVAGVVRWLKDYITRVPGEVVSSGMETELLSRIQEEKLTGAQLLDTPVEELLQMLGHGSKIIDGNEDEFEKEEDGGSLRARLQAELSWLRRDPPSLHLVGAAPHWLLCPLSHALCREPACAADGVTYDRLALHEWFLAADGAVSAVSGRRLRNARVLPNYAARAALREFLQNNETD